jgi:hypothetical protein
MTVFAIPTRLPAPVVLLAFGGVVLGIPLGLYATLTSARRRAVREIREGCSREGWSFHRSHLGGNPTEFRIDGRTHSAVPWSMVCRGTGNYNRGWTTRMALRFPTLAGRTDLAILPREEAGRDIASVALQLSPAAITPQAIAKIEKFSATVAGALEFLKDAVESPSGLDAFDRAYQVLAQKDRTHSLLVDAMLAKRMLDWPADAIAPHSWIAWRDPFGLHVEVRLPGPPNWVTLAHFHELAEALVACVPRVSPAPTPHGLVDRIAEKLLT